MISAFLELVQLDSADKATGPDFQLLCYECLPYPMQSTQNCSLNLPKALLFPPLLYTQNTISLKLELDK